METKMLLWHYNEKCFNKEQWISYIHKFMGELLLLLFYNSAQYTMHSDSR